MSPTTNAVYDTEAVKAKFNVGPEQIRDYLMLVGDASDNVKGAKGIGGVKAAELLNRYGTLEAVYHALTNHGTEFKPAMATSLRDFQPRLADVRTLITLRTDAEIPFAELDNARTPAGGDAPMEDIMPETVTEEVSAAAPVVAEVVSAAAPAIAAAAPVVAAAPPAITGELMAAAPVEFERQLEPRSLGQALQLANHMHAAKLFNGYGSGSAVLSTILAGRELGLQAVASLRGFHVIDGKHALAADAMRGLVLRSGQAKYFRVIERTALVATFETWRKGEPDPVRLSYTIEEGRAAFGFGTDPNEKAAQERESKWQKSAWVKHPADMLSARASSKLARLVYADILFGLYAPEELSENKVA